ncbi:hypothetical protein D3C80_1782420 [compost metagenome]
MGNVLYVNPAGSHIRSNQIAELSSPERIDDFKPLVLQHPAVQLVRGQLLVSQSPE